MKKDILAFIFILQWTVTAGSSVFAGEPIAVIVNKANTTDNVAESELARIYKGETEKWPDGQRVVVVDRAEDSEIRSQFYGKVLNAGPTQRFVPAGSPVVFKTMVVKTDSSIRGFINRIPNAIAYIHLSEANNTVKVLKINGLSPSEDGYVLK